MSYANEKGQPATEDNPQVEVTTLQIEELEPRIAPNNPAPSPPSQPALAVSGLIVDMTAALATIQGLTAQAEETSSAVGPHSNHYQSVNGHGRENLLAV